MSDEPSDFFALPPFKADEALIKLRRDLRELKALSEKGTGALLRFDWCGLPAVELSVAPGDQAALAVALAKKPAQRPDWRKQTLTSSGDVRKFTDEVKRSLRRWDDEA